jgi:hypothetical protein
MLFVCFWLQHFTAASLSQTNLTDLMLIFPDRAIVPITAIPAHNPKVIIDTMACVVVRHRQGLLLTQIFPRILLTPSSYDIPHQIIPTHPS